MLINKNACKANIKFNSKLYKFNLNTKNVKGNKGLKACRIFHPIILQY